MLTAQRIPISHDEPVAQQWDWPLQHNDGIVKVQDLNDRWEVDMDMAYFAPNEIEVGTIFSRWEILNHHFQVKVVGDHLTFHCHHEMRNDNHGTISREVNRSYRLPDSVDKSTIKVGIGNTQLLISNSSFFSSRICCKTEFFV
jgi:crystallin, alpha B